MNAHTLCEWQKVDDDGLIMPWFSHGCLAELRRMDFSGKNILSFGAGMGDAWLARRCKKMIVIERSEEWLMRAAYYGQINSINNIQYLHRICNEGDEGENGRLYYSIPEDFKPDVIINDDILRTEICQIAVDYFKENGGGILICDNWKQSFVWMSPKAEEIMQPYMEEAKIFVQENHTDNDGVNKMKTAIFFIR